MNGPNPRPGASALGSARVFTLPPHTHLKNHVHRAAHLCAVLDGAFRERLGRRDRECTRDTIRVSGPHIDHDIRVDATPARCLVVEFPAEFMDTGTRGAWATQSSFTHAPGLASMAHRLLATPQRGGEVDDLERELLLVELLASVARARRLKRNTPLPAWLYQVRTLLDEEFGAPHRLVDLAASAGVHPSHLARAFRDAFGHTVGQHLRARRLAYARERIARSNEPLRQVAAEAGFADQAHLTRAFSARWGVSPARYRRLRMGRA